MSWYSVPARTRLCIVSSDWIRLCLRLAISSSPPKWAVVAFPFRIIIIHTASTQHYLALIQGDIQISISYWQTPQDQSNVCRITTRAFGRFFHVKSPNICMIRTTSRRPYPAAIIIQFLSIVLRLTSLTGPQPRFAWILFIWIYLANLFLCLLD